MPRLLGIMPSEHIPFLFELLEIFVAWPHSLSGFMADYKVLWVLYLVSYLGEMIWFFDPVEK
jgi:hypothetical protein